MMTNPNLVLEEGEIVDDNCLISNQKTINSKSVTEENKKNSLGKNKVSKSPIAKNTFIRYLVKKRANFSKEEFNKFLGFLTDLVCDKALENPVFDPRILSVTRSDKYNNVIRIQCENFDTYNWLSTIEFSALLKLNVVMCTESNVQRIAMDLLQVDVVIPIIPGSRIRRKEEIIPILKGTNKNSALKFDEWIVKHYDHNSSKINVSFDVNSEIADILRKNNTLLFGTSQAQLHVN